MTQRLGQAVLAMGAGVGVGLFVLALDDRRALLVGAALGLGLTVLLAAWRLPATVLVLVALLPFSEYPSIVSPGRGWFALGPAMISIVAAAWLVGTLLRRHAGARVSSSLWWLMLALLAWIGLLTLAPDDVELMSRVEGAALRAVPILLFFVARSLPWESSRFVHRLWWIILWTGVAVSAMGLRQYFVWLSPAEELFVSFTGADGFGDVALRVFATFRGPWQLACYLGMVLVIGLSLWGLRGPWYRAGVVVALPPIGLAMVFTYARGPAMGLACAFVIMLALRAPGVRAVQRVGWVALAILAAGIALQAGMLHEVERSEPFGFVVARARSLTDPLRDEAVQVRLDVWRTLGALAVERPLGVGLASTGGLSIRHRDKLQLGVLHPDNYYLDTVLTTGWLGLLLLVAIMVVGLRRAAAVARYSGLAGSVGLVSAAWLVLVSVANLTNQFSTNPVIGGYLGIALGAVDCLYRGRPQRDVHRCPRAVAGASREAGVAA